MALCLGCMAEYDENYEVCPHCGYIVNTPAKEAYYLEPGTLLADKYIVGRVVGNGGFGVTYVGWDSVLEQKVAIKEYFPGEFSTRIAGEKQLSIFSGERHEQFVSGKDKFIEEAQRLAKFNKTKGVVHVYDYFEENSTAYIIMEFLDGESFKDKMKKYGPISVNEARDVIIDVLEALKEVHKEGIIHRDIAPDNIMRTKTGEIVLLDFGASRFATTKHSKSLSVILKPGYAPEEQYRSRGDQGSWTDMYAVAATFYKMVTGITPQPSIERSARDLVRKPSKLGVKIPKNLENAIMNAMNIRIESRTQNAEEFLTALNADKVKRKREKIKAADIGKWPLGVKIAAAASVLAVGTFIALMATGVISFSILGTQKTELEEGMVRVPSVLNMTYEEAKQTLSDSMLKIEIEDKEYTNDVPENVVLSQSVAVGDILKQNETIKVVVSAGIEVNTMPELTGFWEDSIGKKLDLYNLKWHKVSVAGENPIDTILSQSITPGTKLEDGMELEILVSGGLPNIENGLDIVVPNVVGQKYSNAKSEILNNSLYAYQFEVVEDKAIPYEYVLEQTLEAGTSVKSGSALGLKVNLAKGKISIPDIKGESLKNVEQDLKDKYFNVTTEYEYDAEVPKNKIAKTYPEIGESVDVGSDLVVVVSNGPEPKKTKSSSGSRYYYDDYYYYDREVTVPNIVGLSQYMAKQTLSECGLYLSGRNYITYFGTEGTWVITAQSPAAGDVVPAYSEITYQMCLGPEYVTVPNLVGLWAWTAYTQCLGIGIQTNTYTKYTETTISYQSIEPGTVVENGTYMYIY